MDTQDNWLDARELFRDLAIPPVYVRFEDWFTSRIQGEFEEGTDWKVDITEDGPIFWITPEVDAQIAAEERGMPAIRLKRMSHEVAELGWNQENNPQTHAITGDDEL